MLNAPSLLFILAKSNYRMGLAAKEPLYDMLLSKLNGRGEVVHCTFKILVVSISNQIKLGGVW
jgi:hypothetical protein